MVLECLRQYVLVQIRQTAREGFDSRGGGGGGGGFFGFFLVASATASGSAAGNATTLVAVRAMTVRILAKCILIETMNDCLQTIVLSIGLVVMEIDGLARLKKSGADATFYV